MLQLDGPLPIKNGSVPFATSWLAAANVGHELTSRNFIEEEYLVRGESALYTYDSAWSLTVARATVPYVTRLLLRRPNDPRDWSGVVHVEVLHEDSGDVTWSRIAPYIMREGDAHVAIQIDPGNVGMLRGLFDPDRYRSLSLPTRGLGWDMLVEVASLVKSTGPENPLPRHADASYLSGWSQTGSVIRTFLGEGFHERIPSDAAFDGYLIGITSGAHFYLRGGYRPICDYVGRLPADDPRRRISGHGVPVFEVLSENEAEAHWPMTRPDSDEPDDPYRLFQIAGMSHVPEPAVSANHAPVAQMRQLGLSRYSVPNLEERGQAPSRYVVRALYHLLDEWARERRVPPRAERMAADPLGTLGLDDLHNEARPLMRDADGNVIGGVRSCALDIPVAAYSPHSTPAAGSVDFATLGAADLTGSQQRFSSADLAARYPGMTYATRVRARAGELIEQGWLLPPEAAAVITEAEASPRAFGHEPMNGLLEGTHPRS